MDLDDASFAAVAKYFSAFGDERGTAVDDGPTARQPPQAPQAFQESAEAGPPLGASERDALSELAAPRIEARPPPPRSPPGAPSMDALIRWSQALDADGDFG